MLYSKPMRYTQDWRLSALCAEIGPEIFAPKDGDPRLYARARPVCAKCPVWRECLIEDLTLSEFKQLDTVAIIPEGIRGGLIPSERYSIIKHIRPLSRESGNSKLELIKEIVWTHTQQELQTMYRIPSEAKKELRAG